MSKKKNINRRKKIRVVLLVDTYRDYRRGLLHGIANYSKHHGLWDVRVEHPSNISKGFALVKNWNADGLIADILHAKDLEKVLSLNIPVIATGDLEEVTEKLWYINPDDFHIGILAANFFIDKGFRFYAFCGYKKSQDYIGQKNWKWSAARYNGYCQTLESSGFSASVFEVICKGPVPHFDKKELTRLANWLKKLPHPIAVFACHDDYARYIVEACRHAQLEIPGDVSVLGVDNDEIDCDFFNPPLSSIALNTERAGYEAAEILEKLITGQIMRPHPIIVPPKFAVERQSTDVLLAEDQDVASALRYIHQHRHQILQVSDVVKAVSVSRRTLISKFNQTVGHTIYEEIRKCHTKYIAELLIETDLPVLNIARSIGYTSERNISRFFHKATGYTPTGYRKKFGRK